MVAERHILDAADLTGDTMRVMHLARPFPLHNLHMLWDVQHQCMVKGEQVLEVVPRIAEARHKAAPQPLRQTEVDECGPRAVGSHPAATYGVVTAASKVQIVRSQEAEYFTIWEAIQVVQSQQSDTMILDRLAPRLQKHLGLRGILKVQQLLNQPLDQLPTVSMGCIHMPGKKPGKRGHDINKVTRPVLAEGGILRLRQRGQWSTVKSRMGAPVLLGFQLRGRKGRRQLHLRRLVYTVTK